MVYRNHDPHSEDQYSRNSLFQPSQTALESLRDCSCLVVMTLGYAWNLSYETSYAQISTGVRRGTMVGWGFAFGRGFVVLLWSIVWAVVAGIVGVLVIGGFLFCFVSYPTAGNSQPKRFITGFLAASSLRNLLLFLFSVLWT